MTEFQTRTSQYLHLLRLSRRLCWAKLGLKCLMTSACRMHTAKTAPTSARWWKPAFGLGKCSRQDFHNQPTRCVQPIRASLAWIVIGTGKLKAVLRASQGYTHFPNLHRATAYVLATSVSGRDFLQGLGVLQTSTAGMLTTQALAMGQGPKAWQLEVPDPSVVARLGARIHALR